jgi:hypothetical protein
VCSLDSRTWGRASGVLEAENEEVPRTFSEQELEQIVEVMKTDTAPGPDCFPIIFVKKFWQLVKHGVMHILNDFLLGRIDIARLNFGVLSLIMKVSSVD